MHRTREPGRRLTRVAANAQLWGWLPVLARQPLLSAARQRKVVATAMNFGDLADTYLIGAKPTSSTTCHYAAPLRATVLEKWLPKAIQPTEAASNVRSALSPVQ